MRDHVDAGVDTRTVAMLAGLAASAALVLLLAPTAVSFGVAVAGAVSWCRWIDEHAESPGT